LSYNSAFALKDPYIFAANVVGLILGLFYILSCVRFANDHEQNDVLKVLLPSLFLIFLTAGITFIILDVNVYKDIFGYMCVAVLIVFYYSPLTTIGTVLRTKSASLIDSRFAFAGLVNSCLWLVYGLLIGNVFVWGPNGLGAFFSTLQLILVLVYRHHIPQDAQGIAAFYPE
jgi:solute carrier family 50 protein (sugar transporter)